MASVRATISRSGSVRASTAALIFCTISAEAMTSLPSKWAAALGEYLIFDLDRVGAGALQHLNVRRIVERIAEAVSASTMSGPKKHRADRETWSVSSVKVTRPLSGMPRDVLADARPGHIGRAEAAIRHHAGGERIGDARQDHRRAGLEHGAELLAGGFRHRTMVPECGKPSSDLASRDQHDGAGGLARFDITVGLGGLAERIALADLDLDLAAADHGEQVVRGFQQRPPGSRCSRSGSGG